MDRILCLYLYVTFTMVSPEKSLSQTFSIFLLSFKKRKPFMYVHTRKYYQHICVLSVDYKGVVILLQKLDPMYKKSSDPQSHKNKKNTSKSKPISSVIMQLLFLLIFTNILSMIASFQPDVFANIHSLIQFKHYLHI